MLHSALWRIHTSIPAELFKILKDDAIKVLHSICQQIWNTQQWLQGWKSVSLHSKAKECSNYHAIQLISYASKVMLKILQARLQQYVNRELPDIQEFQKNIYFCFIDYANASDCVDHKNCTKFCVDHKNCTKFLKRQEYQSTLPVSGEICVQVKK